MANASSLLEPEPVRDNDMAFWLYTSGTTGGPKAAVHLHRDLLGRADDLFKVAGLWVAPADVEAALMAHPGVADVGVVGREDVATGLMKPWAFVVAKDPPRGGTALVDELTALAHALPSHQRPRRITVVSELPRTATGKLQRFVLREWAS